jgi:hypothetical protein
MSTLDWMTPQQLQDLRDAGRGHLIDGAGPLLDKADELRKREREEGHLPQSHRSAQDRQS